jgi:prevent-host-death family protein
MRTIAAGEFKAKCLAMMDEVQARGETIVITKRGKPVARIGPLETASIPEARPIFGFMRGMATITGDIVSSPYSDEEWLRFEDENLAVFDDEKPA